MQDLSQYEKSCDSYSVGKSPVAAITEGQIPVSVIIVGQSPVAVITV